jgi:two-component system phosphate regulon sensor histidine kinase PhoR
VTTPEGEVSGVAAVLHDVTREKEIAQMKTDFVSSVSHELRTPLASIKAYVEMLVDDEAEDEKTRREFYQIMAGEADRLSRLIENILNISRIESGVVRIVREPISLGEAAKDVLEVVQPQARAKNVEVISRLAPTQRQVVADKDMIYQAILNLVGNALKYTAQGGTVTVSTGVDERRGVAVCEISDTGVGIPPEDLPYIFDKFHRVEGHVRIAKGTGLGLTLVKHIIETAHEGKLSVTSEAGKGSTFAFELPALQ